MYVRTEWLCHFLSCSSQLKIYLTDSFVWLLPLSVLWLTMQVCTPNWKWGWCNKGAGQIETRCLFEFQTGNNPHLRISWLKNDWSKAKRQKIRPSPNPSLPTQKQKKKRKPKINFAKPIWYTFARYFLCAVFLLRILVWGSFERLSSQFNLKWRQQ